MGPCDGVAQSEAPAMTLAEEVSPGVSLSPLAWCGKDQYGRKVALWVLGGYNPAKPAANCKPHVYKAD